MIQSDIGFAYKDIISYNGISRTDRGAFGKWCSASKEESDSRIYILRLPSGHILKTKYWDNIVVKIIFSENL